jgi:hypothetical protein
MNRNRSEEGSTALEALIAIALISIALGALVAGTRSGIAVLARARDAADDAQTLVKMDDAIRSAAYRVRIPYWARSVEPAVVDGRLSIPWLDGREDRLLEFSIGEDAVVVAEGDAVLRFSNITAARIDLVKNKGGGASGVALRYAIRDREVSVLAAFGSTALSGGDAR